MESFDKRAVAKYCHLKGFTFLQSKKKIDNTLKDSRNHIQWLKVWFLNLKGFLSTNDELYSGCFLIHLIRQTWQPVTILFSKLKNWLSEDTIGELRKRY